MKAYNLFRLVLVAISILSCQSEKPLPVLGNNPVADFRFVNQDGISITNKTFEGKIYIANFFFTSCTTICPSMNGVVKGIFEEYKSDPEVMFLSHSIDFKYDTPSRLKDYAKRLAVSGNQWQFVTGTKESIYGIAEKSYMSAVTEDSTVKENFVHQGYLLLVDQKRRLRGAYDSDSEEQVTQLRNDIKKLLEE